jgi:hypothetical protein
MTMNSNFEAFGSAEAAIAYYDEKLKHTSALDVLEMFTSLNVTTKIGGATFTIIPRNYPLGAQRRLCVYGSRREPNDGVANLKTDKEKTDTVSLKLGEWESGKYVETRLRVAGLTLEQEIKCKIVLKGLDDEDRKAVDEMAKDKRQETLLDLYEQYSVGDGDIAKAMRGEYDRLMAEATREKPVIKLKLAK